jgi:hypothetical protein
MVPLAKGKVFIGGKEEQKPAKLFERSTHA